MGGHDDFTTLAISTDRDLKDHPNFSHTHPALERLFSPFSIKNSASKKDGLISVEDVSIKKNKVMNVFDSFPIILRKSEYRTSSELNAQQICQHL